MNKLFIFANESISNNLECNYCDNLDLKSIPEGLSSSFEVNLVGRRSRLERKHLIENTKVYLASNIFLFAKFVFNSCKEKNNSKYLVISITPYTFIAFLILFLFRIKPYVYLRSDGYEEYKSILGLIGRPIYHFMFQVTSLISKFISCRKHILRNKKGIVVSPSHLSKNWFKDFKKINIENISLLYVGRIRIEKGIFSFLKIFKNLKNNIELNIVSSRVDHHKIKLTENIKLTDTLSEKSLINFYDNNLIFILPSFTEGHPQVLDEALARRRPVIVFNEISHVKRDRNGVFVCNRNVEDLKKTIDYILKNYSKIQDEIKKNKLPTKEDFLRELTLIIMQNN